MKTLSFVPFRLLLMIAIFSVGAVSPSVAQGQDPLEGEVVNAIAQPVILVNSPPNINATS